MLKSYNRDFFCFHILVSISLAVLASFLSIQKNLDTFLVDQDDICCRYLMMLTGQILVIQVTFSQPHKEAEICYFGCHEIYCTHSCSPAG